VEVLHAASDQTKHWTDVKLVVDEQICFALNKPNWMTPTCSEQLHEYLPWWQLSSFKTIALMLTTDLLVNGLSPRIIRGD